MNRMFNSFMCCSLFCAYQIGMFYGIALEVGGESYAFTSTSMMCRNLYTFYERAIPKAPKIRTMMMNGYLKYDFDIDFAPLFSAITNYSIYIYANVSKCFKMCI